MREILAALDDKLTSEDLDGIIDEIDEDGSGTIDFDGMVFKKFPFAPQYLILLSFRIHGDDDWINQFQQSKYVLSGTD